MKTLKKSLAVLLSILMVLFSVPFSVLAEENLPNVELRAYEAAAGNAGSILWGPTLEEAYVDPLTGIISEGSHIAIAFVMSNTNEYMSAQMEGKYNTTYLSPTSATFRTNGKFQKWNENDYSGKPWIAGVESGAYVTSTEDDYMDGNSLFEEGRILWSKQRVGGCTLTGYTTFEELAYDEETDEYSDVVFTGTYIAVACFTVKADIDADNLYQYFTFDTNNIGEICYQGNDKVPHLMTFGPAGDTPQPAEKVTYTFADGSTQELDADAEAPANTADTEFAHVENTTTHAKTTYSWAADGDKAFKEVGTTVTDNCDMQTVANTAVEADHLTDGKEADTKCSVCGNVVEGAVIKAEGHKYVETVVPPTCVDQGYTELKCSVCDDIQKKDFVEPTGDHNYTVPTGNTRGDADCMHAGEVEFKCATCTKTEWKSGALGAHKLTAVAANEATCTDAGNVAYWSCEVCNKNFADAEGTTEIADVVIPAKGHTLSDVAEVPANCTEAGVGAGKVCSNCNYTEGFETIPAKGHTWVDVDEVPATRAENGVAAGRYCTACDASEGFEVIPALGVDITISGSSLGTATVNGEEVANGVKNVPYAKAYTLVASANDGAEFIGWKVAGKLVSTSETYTTDAFADMTYVPVFVESNADAYTITFVDAYGNVVTSVSSAALPLAELPAAPEFAGLTFDAWSLDLDAVNALTESATVVANYNNDETKKFTVTAAGCTITVDGVESTDTATATYNSEVVVTAAGATAWTVNGSAEPAAYGETYTFYCGSDITVVPVMDAVTAVPAVKVVSFDKTSNHQVKFLATRSIPEGYQLVESGFVYGKGMTAADLVLENVGKTAGNADGVVKQAVCQNKAADGQFALTYGVKSMNATACAVAYAICRGAKGTVVYYSDAMIYNY